MYMKQIASKAENLPESYQKLIQEKTAFYSEIRENIDRFKLQKLIEDNPSKNPFRGSSEEKSHDNTDIYKQIANEFLKGIQDKNAIVLLDNGDNQNSSAEN